MCASFLFLFYIIAASCLLRLPAATVDAAAEAAAADVAAAPVEHTAETSSWAASFLKHDAPKGKRDRSGDHDSDGYSSSESGGGGPLTQEVLDKTFNDLADSERCARIAGPRVSEHFVVKVRGCEKNKKVIGDRLDYARASFVGGEVGHWCEVHFPTKTKDFNLAKCGPANAGSLAKEWCRKMQWYYDLFCAYGSWEAAGAPGCFDDYRESEAYSAWLDALPAGQARAKGIDLRKLRPRSL